MGPRTDTLSDVLQAVRLTGAIYFAVDASEPWVAEAAPSRVLGPRIMPRAEHVIEYHVVLSGSCWGGLLGEPAIPLQSGDVIVFPQGDAHAISSAPGMRGGPTVDEIWSTRSPLPVPLSIEGGGAARSRIICGFWGCDARPFNPLLGALPRVLHARGAIQEGAALRGLVELALAESRAPRPGSASVLARLSELLFIDVVRGHVDALPPAARGWFAGLRDPSVGRALQKLHERPGEPWTLDALARETALSRSLLAERFTTQVGVAPMHYLAQWRIQLAASLLRSTTCGLAEIAERVGYGSEASLSKAFKRWTGLAPAAYRRAKELGADPPPPPPRASEPPASQRP